MNLFFVVMYAVQVFAESLFVFSCISFFWVQFRFYRGEGDKKSLETAQVKLASAIVRIVWFMTLTIMHAVTLDLLTNSRAAFDEWKISHPTQTLLILCLVVGIYSAVFIISQWKKRKVKKESQTKIEISSMMHKDATTEIEQVLHIIKERY